MRDSVTILRLREALPDVLPALEIRLTGAHCRQQEHHNTQRLPEAPYILTFVLKPTKSSWVLRCREFLREHQYGGKDSKKYLDTKSDERVEEEVVKKADANVCWSFKVERWQNALFRVCNTAYKRCIGCAGRWPFALWIIENADQGSREAHQDEEERDDEREPLCSAAFLSLTVAVVDDCWWHGDCSNHGRQQEDGEEYDKHESDSGDELVLAEVLAKRDERCKVRG